MMAVRWPAWASTALLLLLPIGSMPACSGDAAPSAASEQDALDAGELEAPDVTGTPDAPQAAEDSGQGATSDTGDDVGHDTASDTADDAAQAQDTSPDATAPVEIPAYAVALDEEWLTGTMLFGISADPDSPLGQLGQTASGIAPVMARVELEDDRAVFRVVNPKTGEAVDGPDGVIESYPYELLPDGRAMVDLRAPLDTVEIQLYEDCTYQVTAANPIGDPMLADGMVTWAALETFSSKGCSYGALPMALGVDVHYLRLGSAAAGYSTREADPDSPFGYFLTKKGGAMSSTALLDRLPIGPDTPDGSIRYYVGPGFPDELYPAVEAVFDGWNDVFEDAVGVRPLSVEPGADGVIPWNPRYRVITWDPTKNVGAVAPFIADPLTGEMFATQVLLWIGDLPSIVEKYTKLLDDNPDTPWVSFDDPGTTALALPDAGDGGDLPPRVLRRHAFAMRPLDMNEVRDLYLSSGRTLSPEELSLQVVAQFLIHEIGHNVGLRHNFKGSIDREHFPEGTPSTTVMDYVVGMGKPGLYDRDAVRYGYGAGAAEGGFLYCTDEDVALDPGCAQWDLGHPVGYAFKVLDRLAAEWAVDTKVSELQATAEEEEWNKLFTRTRSFFNTGYEQWDPEAPLSAFDELLGRVVCSEGCAVHPWLRAQWALYLLYTKHVVDVYTEWGYDQQWVDFPPLNETQSAMVMQTFYELIVDPAQAALVKEAIIEKLPTAKVDGAQALLEQLDAYYSAIESPTPEEQSLAAAVKAALSS